MIFLSHHLFLLLLVSVIIGTIKTHETNEVSVERALLSKSPHLQRKL